MFWLRDLAEAIKRWDLDHSQILNNAKELGVERLLGVSLELAKEYFDVDVPEEYLIYIESDAVILMRLKKLCSRAIKGPEFPTLRGRFESLYYFMSLISGIKHKMNTLTSVFHRWRIRRFY